MAKLSYIKFKNNDNIENAKLLGISEIDNIQKIAIPTFIDNTEITEISSNALIQMQGIRDIIIPSTIKKIGDSANLGSIMPNSVSSINVSSENSVYTTIDGVLYSKNIDTLIYYPSSKQDKIFTIPETVNIIHSRAFNSNKHLEEIIIKGRRKTIQSKTFYDCSNLQIVNFSCSNISMANDSFIKCPQLFSMHFFGMHRYINEDGVIYYKEHTGKRTMLFYAPINNNLTYKVHPNTTTITSFCFNRPTSLKTLYVPNTCFFGKNTIPPHINIIRYTIEKPEVPNHLKDHNVIYSVKDHNVSNIKTGDPSKKNIEKRKAVKSHSSSNSTKENSNWNKPKFIHPYVLFEGSKNEFNRIGKCSRIVFANGYGISCRITKYTVYIRKERLSSDAIKLLNELEKEHSINILQTSCIRTVDIEEVNKQNSKNKKKKNSKQMAKGCNSYNPFKGRTTANNVIGARIPGARNPVKLWS